LCDVTNARLKDVHKYFKEVKKLIPDHKSTNPDVFIYDFCNKLQFPHEINNISQEIMKNINSWGLIDGKNPRTIAGVSILIGVNLYNQKKEN